MKNLATLVLTVLTSQFAVACLGEAQIIAEVNGVAQTEHGTCAISISAPSVSFYQVNKHCPLELETFLNLPLEIPTKQNGACGIHPGGQISGVLVLNADGKITLE